ncbi:glutaredoxin family protein [Oceanobacillus sp. M65]|uniref:Glutaredoxin family protein n=1 Tax=Oceanobacillus jordanicus TaxID=2867266 RepID=A0AAW5B6X6_9BACI|nr:glutaredoxin family protein [Oceanobacillus jordanicus]AVQ99818.1 hypothetical protein OBCHQ24_12640 [Oceanobacillus iheyensis]MCG3419750.1 glutaredoxin family protein [Oceanobacillus jordanicus]
MRNVILYTKNPCSLCDEAKMMLELLQKDYSFNLIERDIETNDEWMERYHLLIPCVIIGKNFVDGSQMGWNTLVRAFQNDG